MSGRQANRPYPDSPIMNPVWRSETPSDLSARNRSGIVDETAIFRMASKPRPCPDWLYQPRIIARQEVIWKKGGYCASILQGKSDPGENLGCRQSKQLDSMVRYPSKSLCSALCRNWNQYRRRSRMFLLTKTRTRNYPKAPAKMATLCQGSLQYSQTLFSSQA